MVDFKKVKKFSYIFYSGKITIFDPPNSLLKSLTKLFHFFEIDVHTRFLTGPPGCQLSIPGHIPMIWTDFWENSTFLKKSAFWAFLVILGNFSVFMRKCGFVLKIWPNRVWERKKWFEKVVSHCYHVFLSCLGRKIEIDEIFFSHFLRIFLTIHFKGLYKELFFTHKWDFQKSIFSEGLVGAR